MAKFKCGHEKTRENTTAAGRCRECFNAYFQNYRKGVRSPLKQLPPPDDLAENAKSMNKIMLRRHYGVGEVQMNKWLIAAGVDAQKNLSPRRRILPLDFADMAPTMSQAALARHYKVDWTTIKRWKAEAGVETMCPNEMRRQNLQLMKNDRLPSHSFVHKGSAAIPMLRDMRPDTIHDRAADELRRNRWAVHRCDERGRYAEKGKLWRVGNVICTPDELLMRADKCRSRAA